MNYTTTTDFENLIRPFKDNSEKARASYLIVAIEDKLRMKAKQVGKDLDFMIEDGIIYESVLKATVCGILLRCINQDTSNPSSTQTTQSALGYSLTYMPVSNGDLFIKDSEYKTLGIYKNKKRISFHEMG